MEINFVTSKRREKSLELVWWDWRCEWEKWCTKSDFCQAGELIGVRAEWCGCGVVCVRHGLLEVRVDWSAC